VPRGRDDRLARLAPRPRDGGGDAGHGPGDFGDATFTYGSVTSRFFTRDGRYLVNTDGADGRLADFEIRYTFGLHPLQQYLIAFPDRRLQALGIA